MACDKKTRHAKPKVACARLREARKEWKRRCYVICSKGREKKINWGIRRGGAEILPPSPGNQKKMKMKISYVDEVLERHGS